MESCRVAETAKPNRTQDESNPYASVDRIGNAIVGTTLMVLGASIVAHAFGVAFIGFIAALACLVLGFMMTRGSFGDNATVGTLLMVFGPGAVLLPPFFAFLMLMTPAVGGFFLVAGAVKLAGLW